MNVDHSTSQIRSTPQIRQCFSTIEISLLQNEDGINSTPASSEASETESFSATSHP